MFALLIASIPLSVSAAVGFIALLGQVSLAGLLVVSAIETRRTAGAALGDALIDGPVARFRVLVMATLLAILGLTPMAVSHAVGSEPQRPSAVVIISGMVTPCSSRSPCCRWSTRDHRKRPARCGAVAQFRADAIERLPGVRAMTEASYRSGQGGIVELLDALDVITEAHQREIELVAAELDVRAAAHGR